MFSFSIIILCIAIIQVIVLKVLSKFDSLKTISPENLQESIFVSCISYKDPKWVKNIQNYFDNAKCPDRIFVGVVEFIDDEQESMIENIPQQIRNRVKVFTTSSRKAETLRLARELCINHLYGHEKYTMCIRSACMIQNWDEILISYVKKSPPCVITNELNTQNENMFAVIEKIQDGKLVISYKPMSIAKNHSPVAALVCNPDFCFCESIYANIIISDETPEGISAMLNQKKLKCLHPGKCVAQRAQHPRGLRQSSKTKNRHLLHDFYASVGVKNEVPDSHALSGLSQTPDTRECIAKYGSVSHANIAIQLNTFENGNI